MNQWVSLLQTLRVSVRLSFSVQAYPEHWSTSKSMYLRGGQRGQLLRGTWVVLMRMATGHLESVLPGLVCPLSSVGRHLWHSFMFSQKFSCFAVFNVSVKPECARWSSLMMFLLAPLGTTILQPLSIITSILPSFAIESWLLTLSSQVMFWQLLELSVRFDS